MGKDLYSAYYRLESEQSIAKVLMIAEQMGSPKKLPEDKLLYLRNR